MIVAIDGMVCLIAWPRARAVAALMIHCSLPRHSASAAFPDTFHCNPGIGKSLFMYYLMWRLALSGKTIVWDRLFAMPVMFSRWGVFEGPIEAFYLSQPEDAETW